MNQERIDEIAAECASLIGPQTPTVTIRRQIARAIRAALEEAQQPTDPQHPYPPTDQEKP